MSGGLSCPLIHKSLLVIHSVFHQLGGFCTHTQNPKVPDGEGWGIAVVREPTITTANYYIRLNPLVNAGVVDII